jgi:hypothetical protein
MIRRDDTALLTVLLAKHITSCDNVLLKGYFLLATYSNLNWISLEILLSILFGSYFVTFFGTQK